MLTVCFGRIVPRSLAHYSRDARRTLSRKSIYVGMRDHEYTSPLISGDTPPPTPLPLYRISREIFSSMSFTFFAGGDGGGWSGALLLPLTGPTYRKYVDVKKMFCAPQSALPSSFPPHMYGSSPFLNFFVASPFTLREQAN